MSGAEPVRDPRPSERGRGMGAIDVAAGLFRWKAVRRLQRFSVAHVMKTPQAGIADATEYAADLDKIHRGEPVEPFETTTIQKDGRRAIISWSLAPIRDSSHRIVGTVRCARDVTEEKRIEAEWEQRLVSAERARADAQASNRSKDEFLAMLGHELRNPLSALRNAIVSAQLDPRRCKRALEVAWRQTEQLDRLADDILDISLVEQGRVRLKRRCTPLHEIIEHAVETTRRFVEERRHTLSVSAPAEPVHVDGDPLRLEQIVANLVKNAAKYTGDGGRIDLFLERDGAEAVLRVRDTGIGISADILPRIFDMFFQGERALEHQQDGFGIGLSVVRSLVSLHDGRIEARSDGLGKGAEFVVHLPAAPMSAFEPAASPLAIVA
jgi:signal transduction histidine kinase